LGVAIVTCTTGAGAWLAGALVAGALVAGAKLTAELEPCDVQPAKTATAASSELAPGRVRIMRPLEPGECDSRAVPRRPRRQVFRDCVSPKIRRRSPDVAGSAPLFTTSDHFEFHAQE